MSGGLNTIGNIVALVLGAAIVAILAAKPEIVHTFFSGVANVTNAATAPVR
jgi:Ca2+/Na+ antiporter